MNSSKRRTTCCAAESAGVARAVSSEAIGGRTAAESVAAFSATRSAAMTVASLVRKNTSGTASRVSG
jgi:hypothetical protein